MLLGTGAAATFFAAAPLRRALAQESKAVIHETRIISRQPNLYHGWPTVTRRKNGELLLVCSSGREDHVCPFGRLEMMRSRDEGKTWGWPRVLIDAEIDVRGAGIIVTDKGTLLATAFTSTAYVDWMRRGIEQAESDKPGDWSAERVDCWRAAHERISDEQRKKLLGVWMVRSTDGGLTWSASYDCLVDSPHGPIQLSDGRLLYAGKDLWRGGRVGVCESTDDGKTWRWSAEISSRKGEKADKNYYEPHAVETADGRIVVHIRYHSNKNQRETLQTESSDGGKTWTKLHSTGIRGYPSHLVRLKDGRLLATYGWRHRPSYGNQACVSDDNGRTWSEPIVISKDGAGGDLGYPSTVQLADGSLLTVWYEKLKTSPRAVLRQAHWSLD